MATHQKPTATCLDGRGRCSFSRRDDEGTEDPSRYDVVASGTGRGAVRSHAVRRVVCAHPGRRWEESYHFDTTVGARGQATHTVATSSSHREDLARTKDARVALASSYELDVVVVRNARSGERCGEIRIHRA